MPRSPLAAAVLKLLDERPMHPYELQQCIRERRLDFVLKLKSGSLYHTVERLEHAGLIEPLEINRDGRRPERTVYAITERGRDEFRDWLRDLLSEPVQEFPQFAAALAFMTSLAKDEVVQLLIRRTVSVEAGLAAFESAQYTLQQHGLPRIHLIEAEYGQALRRAELEWLRTIVRELKDGTLDWPPAEPLLHELSVPMTATRSEKEEEHVRNER
jgi:DNA-binding PadR family transcriptional regulator